MNAIEEAYNIQNIFVFFGVPAYSIKKLEQMEDEAILNHFKKIKLLVQQNQTHAEIEMLRDYFGELLDVLKVRGSKRALRNLGVKNV